MKHHEGQRTWRATSYFCNMKWPPSIRRRVYCLFNKKSPQKRAKNPRVLSEPYMNGFKMGWLLRKSLCHQKSFALFNRITGSLSNRYLWTGCGWDVNWVIVTGVESRRFVIAPLHSAIRMRFKQIFRIMDAVTFPFLLQFSSSRKVISSTWCWASYAQCLRLIDMTSSDESTSELMIPYCWTASWSELPAPELLHGCR